MVLLIWHEAALSSPSALGKFLEHGQIRTKLQRYSLPYPRIVLCRRR